jgi:hypothetical protein
MAGAEDGGDDRLTTPREPPGRPGFGEVLRGHRRAARLTLEQLAEVSGVPAEVAWDALDELVDLGLLHDSAAGRYRFHDLVRLFARTRLEEEESPAEREALTARVTRAAQVHDATSDAEASSRHHAAVTPAL